MAKKELRTEIVNRLKGSKKTLPEMASEVGATLKAVTNSMTALVSEGIVLQEADFYYVTDEDGSRPDLSQLEWRIVNLLRERKGKPLQLTELTKTLGTAEVPEAVDQLVAAKLVVKNENGGYRITSETEFNIPLSLDERDELRAAEDRIDELVGEVYGRQLEVAQELRRIRDRKLYRETHSRFADYVNERFERTRDWAYKVIRDLEVSEGLAAGKANPDVEALIQTVTAREMPHLARLKKEPFRMQKALLEADDKAKSEDRERTPDDVKEAINKVTASVKPKKEPQPEPSHLRTVEFVGIDHEDGLTDNLPKFLTEFAKWFRQNPTDGEFTIRVGPIVQN